MTRGADLNLITRLQSAVSSTITQTSGLKSFGGMSGMSCAATRLLRVTAEASLVGLTGLSSSDRSAEQPKHGAACLADMYTSSRWSARWI